MDLYIIFGMNDFNSPIVPYNYIVYQLEQTICQDESKWFSSNVPEYLKKALEVWDYSVMNYRLLKKWGVTRVKYVPLRYMSILNRIQHIEYDKKEIDFLFYGALNERRQGIIDQN